MLLGAARISALGGVLFDTGIISDVRLLGGGTYEITLSINVPVNELYIGVQPLAATGRFNSAAFLTSVVPNAMAVRISSAGVGANTEFYLSVERVRESDFSNSAIQSPISAPPGIIQPPPQILVPWTVGGQEVGQVWSNEDGSIALILDKAAGARNAQLLFPTEPVAPNTRIGNTFAAFPQYFGLISDVNDISLGIIGDPTLYLQFGDIFPPPHGLGRIQAGSQGAVGNNTIFVVVTDPDRTSVFLGTERGIYAVHPVTFGRSIALLPPNADNRPAILWPGPLTDGIKLLGDNEPLHLGGADQLAGDFQMFWDGTNLVANPRALGGIGVYQILAPISFLETGGPTQLTSGAIGDGQVLTRSGATIVGSGGSGGVLGYVLAWGARMNTLGNFVSAWARADGSDVGVLDANSEITVPKAGTMTTLSWNSLLADATTVMKILRNAVVVETITLSGAVGTDSSLATTVVAGDQIAIEFDAATAPGESNWVLYIE